MIIKGLIPKKEHTNLAGQVSAYNDEDAYVMRAAEFEPNGSAAANIGALLYSAATAGVPTEKLEEIKTAEETGFKAYIAPFWSLAQQLYALSILNRDLPIMFGKHSSEDYNIYTKDTWHTKLNHMDLMDLPEVPGLLEVIREINLKVNVRDYYEPQNLPSETVIYWSPHLTSAEFDTTLDTCIANSKSFINFCGRVGLPVKSFNAREFVKREPIVVQGMDFTDYRWLWANSTFPLQRRNSAGNGDVELIPSDNGATPALSSSEDWITNLSYIFRQDGDPHALCALTELFYKYDATHNPLGCYAGGDNKSLGIAGSIAANEIYAGNIAINDVDGSAADAFDWITDQEFQYFAPSAFYYLLGHNATRGSEKEIGDGRTIKAVSNNSAMPRCRYNLYTAGVWDTDAAIALHRVPLMFFRKMIRGDIGGRDSTLSNKVDRRRSFQK